MGSIPSTDQQFLEWCGYQTKKQSPLDMMRLYVSQLNVESQVVYERKVKERKEQLILATNMADAVPESEPLETTALSEANETSMNNPNPQEPPPRKMCLFTGNFLFEKQEGKGYIFLAST